MGIYIYNSDVDKISLFVKSHNEYIITYNDASKNKIVPLQLKIRNVYFGELHMYMSNIKEMPIHSDDKELFRKCREIWDKINELIGINNPRGFVEISLDDDDQFVMVYIEKNTSAVKDKYRNNLVFVLHSVINDFPQVSLVQYRY